jgi:cation diffusion facilitator CzcD-associated flavoprotein CzcO
MQRHFHPAGGGSAPQHWPEGLDYRGKRVVVIGSGATAVTLVPAMADQAEHVTMLQRSSMRVISSRASPRSRRASSARRSASSKRSSSSRIEAAEAAGVSSSAI